MNPEVIGPITPMIDEKSNMSESERLLKAHKWERAQNVFLGVAVGFGGSLSFLLIDAIMYGDIRNGSLLMIGFVSFLMFIFAIAAARKVPASKEAL